MMKRREVERQQAARLEPFGHLVAAEEMEEGRRAGDGRGRRGAVGAIAPAGGVDGGVTPLAPLARRLPAAADDRCVRPGAAPTGAKGTACRCPAPRGAWALTRGPAWQCQQCRWAVNHEPA